MSVASGAFKVGKKYAFKQGTEAAGRMAMKNAKVFQAAQRTIAKYPVAEGFKDILGSMGKKGSLKAGQVFKDGLWNMGHAFKAEGGFMANYGKQMFVGAVGNAAIQGGIEWGQGGSFWEGAKGGLVTGALAGGAYGGLKASVGTPGATGSLMGTGSRVSKQVQAMFRTGTAAKVADAAMHTK